jgi:hypothetical protein
MVAANVVDHELRQVVGDSTMVNFDLASWAVLEGCQGETLVEAAQGTAYAGRPLMVEVEFGDGAVFYTSFTTGPRSLNKKESCCSCWC